MAKTLFIDIDFPISHQSLDETLIQPEKRLLCAIMEKAISDALYSTGRVVDSLRWSREALGWIYNITDGPFSFEWVARELEIDPQSIRDFVRVSRLQKRKYFKIKDRIRNNELYAA